MAKVVPARMAAHIDGDFVVFLIGMRFNKPWKIHKWWSVATSMGKMLQALYSDPDSGLLGHTSSLTSNGPMLVQYWRSTEQLQAFARGTDQLHRPAWKAFNKLVGYGRGGEVGVWHETYVVQAGQYECVYGNMPRFGLAKAAEHVPVARKGEGAAERLSMAGK